VNWLRLGAISFLIVYSGMWCFCISLSRKRIKRESSATLELFPQLWSLGDDTIAPHLLRITFLMPLSYFGKAM